MTITRRDIIRRGAITAAVAVVPTVAQAKTPSLDPEALEVVSVFMLLEDNSRALLHELARSFAGLPIDPALELRWDKEAREATS